MIMYTLSLNLSLEASRNIYGLFIQMIKAFVVDTSVFVFLFLQIHLEAQMS